MGARGPGSSVRAWSSSRGSRPSRCSSSSRPCSLPTRPGRTAAGTTVESIAGGSAVDDDEEGTIEAIALIARLKPGAESQAEALVRSGPPFDPTSLGLTGHRVFLSAGEAVFVFEGHEVEWMLDDLVSDPNAWQTHEALEAWRPLIEFPPRIGREAYAWERE